MSCILPQETRGLEPSAGDEELSEAIKELIRRMEEVAVFRVPLVPLVIRDQEWRKIVLVTEELYGSVVKGSRMMVKTKLM